MQKAKDLKIEVPDADITPTSIARSGIARAILIGNGIPQRALEGVARHARRVSASILMDQFRRRSTHEQKSPQAPAGRQDRSGERHGRADRRGVRAREAVPRPKPATVTLHQIVIAPQATAAQRKSRE